MTVTRGAKVNYPLLSVSTSFNNPFLSFSPRFSGFITRLHIKYNCLVRERSESVRERSESVRERSESVGRLRTRSAPLYQEQPLIQKNEI